MWLDFVTYLHHHGHEQKLPWYRGKVLTNFLVPLFRFVVNYDVLVITYNPNEYKRKNTHTKVEIIKLLTF